MLCFGKEVSEWHVQSSRTKKIISLLDAAVMSWVRIHPIALYIWANPREVDGSLRPRGQWFALNGHLTNDRNMNAYPIVEISSRKKKGSTISDSNGLRQRRDRFEISPRFRSRHEGSEMTKSLHTAMLIPAFLALTSVNGA